MSERQAVFSTAFLDDLAYRVRNDRKVALRLLRIVGDCLRDPFTGIGRPEPLKRRLSGLWSRRLKEEHRVVYEVTPDAIRFVQARYHY